MTSRLVDNQNEFDNLRDIAAEQLGVPAGAIEKDYWATQALRSVIAPSENVTTIIFKGGTSLSKAFGLIQRFSEDIDVLVRFSADTSKRGCERAFKALGVRAAEELGVELRNEGRDEAHYNARLHYEARAPVTFLTDGVLLEMGTAGGEYPNENCNVTSLMAGVAIERDASAIDEFADLAPFEITCLAPHRTLAEKLAFLHHRATINDAAALARGARHVYDVALLLDTADTHARLTAEPLTSFMADIDQHTSAAGYAFTPRPDSGFGTSPAFSDTDALNALRSGYADITDLVWGRHPSFDEAIETIRSHSDLL